MKAFYPITRTLLAVASLSMASMAQAQWTLDTAQSSLQFVSVKNAVVGEVNSFHSLSGAISGSGEAKLEIQLGSVETQIPIRNERMLEMLFEVVEFPTAQISARLDADTLAALGEGETQRMTLPMTLSLHGFEQEIEVPLQAVSAGGKLYVHSQAPVMVNAADFGLDGGIEKLRQVAGLNTISAAVPVTFSLQFSAD